MYDYFSIKSASALWASAEPKNYPMIIPQTQPAAPIFISGDSNSHPRMAKMVIKPISFFMNYFFTTVICRPLALNAPTAAGFWLFEIRNYLTAKLPSLNHKLPFCERLFDVGQVKPVNAAIENK